MSPERLFTGTEGGWVYALDSASGSVRWSERVGERLHAPVVEADTRLFAASNVVRSFAASGERRWRTPLSGDEYPSGRHPLVATADRLLVGTNAGVVYALDPTDGEVRWRRDGFGSRVSCCRAGDGVVVVAAVDGDVAAFDPGDGSERWRVDAGRDPSVWVDGNGVYVTGSGNSGEAHVAALDVTSGAGRWTRKLDWPEVYAPSAAEGGVYVGTGDPASGRGGLLSLRASDGTPRWSAELDEQVAVRPTTRPDGGVLVGTPDGGVHAFDDGGERRWRFEVDGSVVTPVATTGSELFVGTHVGGVYALSA